MKENLKGQKSTDEERRRLEEVLKEMRTEDEEEVDEEKMERWQELADKDDLTLDDLTEDERRAFLDAVEKNEIEVPFWEPWWESIEVEDYEVPPHLCCSSSPTEPELAWSLAEVLFDYCSLLRRFDGESKALLNFESHCPVWSVKHRPIDGGASVFCAHITYSRGHKLRDLVLPSLWDIAHVSQTLAFVMRILREVRKTLKERWRRKVDFFLSYAYYHSDWIAQIAPGIENWVVQHMQEKKEAEEAHALRKAPGKDGIKLPTSSS